MEFNLLSFLVLIIKLKSNLLFGVQEIFSSSILIFFFVEFFYYDSARVRSFIKISWLSC